MKIICILIIASLSFLTKLQAQYEHFSIPDDKVLKIRQALDSIYTLKFEGANLLIESLEAEMPDYAGIDLLRAYYYVWAYKPLKVGNAAFDDFLKLATTIEQKCANNKDDPESIFYILSIHALIANAYVDNNANMKAVKEVQKAYKYLKRGKIYLNELPDLNLYLGIYNYYREKYPEDNPYVKPILWFFMNGNKAEGIQMLKNGSAYGLFTKIECTTFLMHILFRYEFLPEESIKYARQLNELYPENETFITLLVENLLYLGAYDEALELINQIENSQQHYYRYAGNIYKGIYYELYELDLNKAKNCYLKAIDIGNTYNVTTPHLEAMCYLGIGRVNLKNGNITDAKHNLKMAVKVSGYKFVHDEAKSLLDSF